VVVKADGLAAGKGVAICDDETSAGAAIERFCENGGAVVVEEFLAGHEASCMALVDGEHVHMLPACEDHKTVFDGDVGPMTGGMGAISPTSVIDAALLARVEREILIPIARALVSQGRPFRGLLYAGVMVGSDGPKVLEFNCRFGDPEAEALLHRFRGDLAEALLTVALGEGRAPVLAFAPGSACSVVLCARGYPGTVEKGAEITGIEAARATGAEVFHAGTRRVMGRLLVDGGRVLAVTASGDDLPQARARAYAAAALIHFDGKHHRSDIGARPRR
jgi:phosphoribosylamine--glycine ligase